VLTYSEVGGTRGGDMPGGYRHVRRDAVVGHGEAAFAAVREGMRQWRIHRLAGMRVRSPGGPVAGERFVATLGFLHIPCEVVWVRDEPGAYGYGFGTLPGHPARGEEAFEVTLSGDGDVRFAVRAFSRHSAWYARLGGPITTFMQERMTDRYVAGARKLAQRQ
jgi:uncharacterized protein (UPF0548 family)